MPALNTVGPDDAGQALTATGQIAARYARPCGHYSAALAAVCGQVLARAYIQGPRCHQHTPSAIAGVPEPPPGRCAPGRCYCRTAGCPAFEAERARHTLTVLPDQAHPRNP